MCHLYLILILLFFWFFIFVVRVRITAATDHRNKSLRLCWPGQRRRRDWSLTLQIAWQLKKKQTKSSKPCNKLPLRFERRNSGDSNRLLFTFTDGVDRAKQQNPANPTAYQQARR